MSNSIKMSPSMPIISLVQKINLYETKTRFIVVGSNNTQTRFRVLKIDRTELKSELIVIDDKVEYTQTEIRDLLLRNDIGKKSGKSSSSTNRTISAYGIVGFIRFLEGYYLIIITKRRRVAQIGHHPIYKIEDTTMVYIPNEIDKNNYDELKYVKMFQNIDLSSNFYFSYSYDITHTLQYNMEPFRLINSPEANDTNMNETQTVWEMNDNDAPINSVSHRGGVRTKPNYKFVWNEHLLKCVDLHSDWILFITHGFVSQTNISVFGRPLYLTLIAKRSQRYAGTRFLKRGANCEGDSANEVETEQIVHDSSISSFNDGFFTSFVQMRGSIPSQWSQDISKMVPKPPITIDIVDPFCYAASRHFNDLLYTYGSPIFVLNLVKRREQKPQESVLSDEFIDTINYLNQFLPPKHQINYIGFDMARVNKLKDENVMIRLSQIAYSTIKATGIFQSRTPYFMQREKKYLCGYRFPCGRVIQTGIVRVNCVDCLDRTNTAQFALGKAALSFQLYSLGVITKPELEFETDTIRMLEELYEDHGDTLALQYGGSQLVHRIKTYRKIAPLSSHSRDIMQTLSRYYSNAFSDAEKQNVINLFLGVYEACKATPIWDLSTDFYLHHSLANGRILTKADTMRYTHWWDDDVAKCLPRAALEVYKGRPDLVMSITNETYPDEKTDGYYEQYKPYEFTVFADAIAFNMLHTCKDFMPNFNTDYSPFRVRGRPGKRRESLMGSSGAKIPPPNPSVSGHASTSSTSSEFESETEEDDADDALDNMTNYDVFNSNDEIEESSLSHNSPVRTFASVLTNSEQKYGICFTPPKTKDIKLYDNFINIGLNSGEMIKKDNFLNITQSKQSDSNTYSDSSFSVKLKNISENNLEIYREYVRIGIEGSSKPSKNSLDIYKRYLNIYQKSTSN